MPKRCKKINLGIIYKNGKIINHRSLLKVIMNPFLRLIGLQIATVSENNKLYYSRLVRCPQKCQFNWTCLIEENVIVVKKRMFI